eukprot:gnl/TRDRNA2_/TRDRNA2_175226_c2_seq1.p4 gnl/TRDRNA2_/TRDRNA2_175226_c2~~gnl/TRDRNA2_/TRDRNA2_175226_c2_seq1.p4  ORF type:complete len:101 (-),score=30.73 gnl/TRDRNA2_/TRDRNA2_175226_c2_seq1:8-310(-)
MPPAGKKPLPVSDAGGWDMDFDDDDDAPQPTTAPASTVSADDQRALQASAEADSLRAELAVAEGRVTHLQDELEAERAVNSEGVISALRGEAASLSEALV